MKKFIYLLFLIIFYKSYSQCYTSVSSKGFHNLAVKSDGTLWAWGNNSYDQIGDNSNTNQTTPKQIGTDTDWLTAYCGTYHSLALKTDGTLWAWGWNDYDQTVNWADIPQMIGTDTDWVSAAAGLNNSAAIKSDGTLWIWGWNEYGQLGNGITMDGSDVPIQVGTDNNWKYVSIGSQQVHALKTDGTLWAWGSNSRGVLGLGDTANRHYPTQVGLNTWLKVSTGYSAALAIRSDGTLWVWGYNEYGMIGDGTTTDKHSPVQVGTATDWKEVSITTHCMAIKNNGTLWAWGRNNYGKIGNGVSSGVQLTPVQVGTDTDWIKAVPGFEHSIAIKGSGTIYTWGHNNFGQLGDGTIIDKVLPLQIGAACSQNLCAVNPTFLSAVNSECTVESAIPPLLNDNCGNAVSPTLYTGTFPITGNGTHSIVWKYQNTIGETLISQEIIINDITEPVPDTAVLSTLSAQCAIIDVAAPTATDNCN